MKTCMKEQLLNHQGEIWITNLSLKNCVVCEVRNRVLWTCSPTVCFVPISEHTLQFLGVIPMLFFLWPSTFFQSLILLQKLHPTSVCGWHWILSCLTSFSLFVNSLQLWITVYAKIIKMNLRNITINIRIETFFY